MSETMGQERTEEATPKRRTDARKKGTVAKSSDTTNAIVLIAFVIVLPFTVARIGQALMFSMNRSIGNIPSDVHASTLWGYLWDSAQPAVVAMAPFLLTAIVAGLVANFAQVGFVISPEAMKPNFSKISPMKGAKRLFSRTIVMEGLKATAKCSVFGYIAYTAIASQWPRLVSISSLPPAGALGVVGEVLKMMLIRITMVWLVLGAIDYFFQRKQVNKQLMMTKEELKQEYREMESSPEMRGARMQRMRKLAKSRMKQSVATADAIITNPTHFSIAIKYEPGKMHAPQVVAKGQDYLALKIREIAAENKVPIIPNPPLARQLYKKCEVGDFVPRDLFNAVAEVLAYVYRTIGDVRKKQ
ncbi:MAG: flagellar biosynthesis protein FlhB [Fimbriimonadaceae bacterium]|nr:flagellar biosynthesis protein FlhB [Fimbriimonadaceae bacterium]